MLRRRIVALRQRIKDQQTIKDTSHSSPISTLGFVVFIFEYSRNSSFVSSEITFGRRHLHFDKLIARCAGIAQRRCATITQTKLLSRLRSRRYSQLRFAVHRRHFNLCTQALLPGL